MSTTTAQSATAGAPRYIRIDGVDNVAIVVNDFGLGKGTRFPCGLELREHVPQGHKVALVDIAKGAPVRPWQYPIEQVGWDLFHLMLDIASGRRKTWTERWKLNNSLALFNPAPIT